MKRESGFYWTCIGETWVVSYYNSKLSEWYMTNIQGGLKDDWFAKIDENQIKRAEDENTLGVFDEVTEFNQEMYDKLISRRDNKIKFGGDNPEPWITKTNTMTPEKALDRAANEHSDKFELDTDRYDAEDVARLAVYNAFLAGHAHDRWVNVTPETMPDKGRNILLWFETTNTWCGIHYEGELPITATKWAYVTLPQPPKHG